MLLLTCTQVLVTEPPGTVFPATAWWQIWGRCLSPPLHSMPRAVSGALEQICLCPDTQYNY